MIQLRTKASKIFHVLVITAGQMIVYWVCSH